MAVMVLKMTPDLLGFGLAWASITLDAEPAGIRAFSNGMYVV
nr:hypothetical protein [uncultured Cohaesibacter sp.]